MANPTARSPVVVRRDLNSGRGELLRLLPAGLISALFNGGILGLLFLISSPGKAEPPLDAKTPEVVVQQEAPPPEDNAKDPLITPDIDESAKTSQQDSNFSLNRQDKFSIPGMVEPLEKVGTPGGDDRAPVNMPLPKGFGTQGTVGAIESQNGNGSFAGIGDGFGALTGSKLMPGSFQGRGGTTREWALVNGGGTRESEAAVNLGLQWIARNQAADGHWALDGNFKDRGNTNNVAGTAFGLLPLLGAGKTHKPGNNKELNPFDKPVEKGLLWLIRRQNPQDGSFTHDMYAHGLATIAICEAYGLTQDPRLRRPAQAAVNFIVRAQHSAGGWRYGPGQPGDTSVSGWQIMALKSAQMAGLEVPDITMKKAQAYLNSVCGETNEGYGYVGKGSTPVMSAVGLLCRQYLQSWGPKNPRLIKGIDQNIKPYPPGSLKNMYYYYYATQVMHHFGGESWKAWNEKMREGLIKSQDKTSGPNQGSWSSDGDALGKSGGRLMITSLTLLTLEVYYRHLPLYYRETGK